MTTLQYKLLIAVAKAVMYYLNRNGEYTPYSQEITNTIRDLENGVGR